MTFLNLNFPTRKPVFYMFYTLVLANVSKMTDLCVSLCSLISIFVFQRIDQSVKHLVLGTVQDTEKLGQLFIMNRLT